MVDGERQGVHRPWSVGNRLCIGYGLIGIVAAVVGGYLTMTTGPVGCPGFHPAVQLAGSNDRLARLLEGCSALGTFSDTVLWDFLFLVGYGLAGTAVLRLTWARYYASQLATTKALVAWIPAIAAALDAVENGLILVLVSSDAATGGLSYAGDAVGGTAIATVAWLKWVALAALLGAAVLGVFALGNGRRPVVRSDFPRPYRRTAASPVRPEPAGERGREEGIGIACSGGGIRAAAFTLGALKAVEAGAVMPRVATVAAVSGGGYAATAWMLTRATSEGPRKDRAAADVHAWLSGPIVEGGSARRHRYLLNSPSGLGRAVVLAAALIATNVAGLASLLALVAWPVGRLLGSDLVRPDLRREPPSWALTAPTGIPPELGLPMLALAALGAVALVSSLAWVRLSRLLVRTAMTSFALAALLALTLVGLPALIDALRGSAVSGIPPLVASGSALTGVAIAVWRIVRKPVVEQVLSRASRLGGVLLVVAAVLFAGAVMNDAARGDGLFGSPLFLGATALFAAVFAVRLNTNALSLQRLFRMRLTSTFGLVRTAGGELAAPPAGEQVRWSELVGYPIELVLCCTQASSHLGLAGFRANSFVISPRLVQVDGLPESTASYLGLLPRRMWRFHSVVAWSGVSGAAFASAMGRLDLGSTNALLAASNIDLGTWLPNPKEAAAKGGLPHLRLSYLIKEILGWYNTDDPYTFLTDGGHWDNLGLVELLRRRHRTIICVDASADGPGTFATLRAAAAMARLAIQDVDVRIDLGPLDAPMDHTGLAAQAIYRLHVRYVPPTGEPECGEIIYAKAQPGADMPVELRRFAAGDRQFPLYATSDQFLADEQFEKLVELGEYAGGAAVAAVPAPWRRASCDACAAEPEPRDATEQIRDAVATPS